VHHPRSYQKSNLATEVLTAREHEGSKGTPRHHAETNPTLGQADSPSKKLCGRKKKDPCAFERHSSTQVHGAKIHSEMERPGVSTCGSTKSEEGEIRLGITRERRRLKTGRKKKERHCRIETDERDLGQASRGLHWRPELAYDLTLRLPKIRERKNHELTGEERREKPTLGARTKTSCESTAGERTEIDLEPKNQRT
jgi:hypothetical protein